MQTTTQERQALTDAQAQAKRTRHIFLICFLDAQRSAQELEKHRNALVRRSKKSTPLQAALWDGLFALHKETNACARELTQRGQLLFAFPGTTALEGCAA